MFSALSRSYVHMSGQQDIFITQGTRKAAEHQHHFSINASYQRPKLSNSIKMQCWMERGKRRKTRKEVANERLAVLMRLCAVLVVFSIAAVLNTSLG